MRTPLQTVNKVLKYNLWARRAMPAQLTPCGFAPFRASEEQGEAYKTGELAENRRFFDKQRSTRRGAPFAKLHYCV